MRVKIKRNIYRMMLFHRNRTTEEVSKIRIGEIEKLFGHSINVEKKFLVEED